MNILVVEDDLKLKAHLEQSLSEEGYFITVADSEASLRKLLNSKKHFDTVILDRLLGHFDTKTVIEDLRKRWASSSIIVVSAISTPNERIDLINIGADDYLGKPFSTLELIARVRAQNRKKSSVSPPGNFLQIGNLTIDNVKRVIFVGQHSEILPGKEFTLLRTLAQSPGKIWSRDSLLDYIWGHAADVQTNVVESTIANLRRKLEEIGSDAKINNLRRAGYWIAL